MKSTYSWNDETKSEEQMKRKFESDSEESINLIMESLKSVGIDCRRTRPGEEGGIYYKNEQGSIEKFEPTFQEVFPEIVTLSGVN